jgi:hypothetical protein
MADVDAISNAVSRSSTVVSLLGPNTLFGLDPKAFSDFYEQLFDLMRQHGVRRVFGMSTLSFPQPQDTFSIQRLLILILVLIVANKGYQTAVAIARAFEEHADGLDWTVYRIAGIPGGSDEKSWKEDREDGEAFEGWIGHPGWTAGQKRGALARWLVDAVEDGKPQWIGKMPAVSRLARSKKKAA